MKTLHKILPFAVCGAMIFSACDDDKMDWHTPEGHSPISSIDEIPLSTDEAMANYKFIKEYMSEYMPGVTIGLGLGADNYLADENYQKVAANNFSQFVTGNAMKFGVVCTNSGTLNFSKIDEFIAKAKETNPDVKLYGHNLLWHTQQPQTYLKSLIAPEQIIKIDEGETIENIVPNFDFESGNTSSWGAYSSGGCKIEISDEGDGFSSNYSGKLTNPADPGNNYSAQAYVTLPSMSCTVGDIYKISYDYKADHIDENFQAEWQNRSSYSAKKYFKSAITKADTWLHFEEEFTITEDMVTLVESNPDKMHITFDFGAATGTVWVDNVKFGKKIEEQSDPMVNIITNSNFDAGNTTGWGAYSGNGCTITLSEEGDSYSGKYSGMLTNLVAGQNYSAQAYFTLPETSYNEGDSYMLTFWYKADHIDEKFQAEWQNRSSYSAKKYFSSPITKADTWLYFEEEFSVTEEMVTLAENNPDKMHITFDFGAVEGKVWIDDVKFGKKVATSKRSLSKATTITYKPMSLEEKQTALYGAMEKWITEMIGHCKPLGVTEWEVLNECISDGDHKLRGVEGGWMSGDSEPVENETDGLNLNWASSTGNQHFYWGYYLGKDYAVKAFQFARAAAGDDAKLYINDYNLETSDGKLEALIDYVKYIDETNGGAIVDGIGTQMHIMCFNTDDSKNDAAKEGIKNMFTKLAATGKLVRISELDVAFSATHDDETKVSPSAEQLQAQSDTYKFVIEQYKAIVPTAQQGGICIWTLTDSDSEHEYWLKGDKPNLFNADYSRKPAYKGVCDGIAGKDLSEEFTGSQWSNK